MYTKGFWIIFASCRQIGSKVVWGKCEWFIANYPKTHLTTYSFLSSEGSFGKDNSVETLRISNRPSVQELWNMVDPADQNGLYGPKK